jgi:predicted nucleotidyltransferase
MRANEFIPEISDKTLQSYLGKAELQVSNRLDRMSRASERLNKNYEIYDVTEPTRIIDRFEADTPQQARSHYTDFIQNYNSDVDFEFGLRRSTGLVEGSEHFNGIEISMEKQDDEITVKAMMAGGRELGHVLFVIDGGYLMPQDLEVDERYQGQGIAATMYDYVKSKGYKIRRSGQQTDAGAGFWNKHKSGKNVWEQDLAEGLEVDVPNEDWLQDKIDYAKSKGRNSFGVPYMGSTTASVRGTPPRVRVMRLASLPGMRNEQMNVRKDDLKWLMDYMERTGKLPPKSSDPNDEYLPFIMVAYNGEAWVNEGNHRIMAAYRLNWPDMPVEIRYFDGGERVASGPMAPGKIGLGPVKEQQGVTEGSEQDDKKIEIFQHLKQIPLTVFGSTVTKSFQEANDFDVFLDLDQNPTHKKFVRPVLSLARKYYGWIDPFVLKDGVLYVRNDDATTWTKAKNSLAILQQIRANGKSIDDIDLQGVAENFADGKGPGRPGDSVRHGIPKGATMAELEKASHAKGRKGQLARWQLNMRRGHKK